MKRILLALALVFGLPSLALAQCNGIFPASNVCGTTAAGPNIPGPLPLASFALAPAGISGQLQTNNGSGGLGAVPTPNGDCTFNTTTGTFVCTKTNTVAFGSLATQSSVTAAQLPSGVSANVLQTQTLPFTITNGNTPCGTTTNIAGGPGILTLSTVAGFNSVCVIQVCNTAVNSNTTHAINLSGFPVPSLPHLWMSQCEEVSIINGAWQVTKFPGKFIPTFTPTCYVNTAGSNSNDGLVNNTQGVIDPQQCINIWMQEFDFNSGFQPTIALTNGQTASQNGGAGALTLIGGAPKVVLVQGNGGPATLQNTLGNVITQTQDFGGYFIYSNIVIDCTNAASHPCYGYFGHQQGGIDINATTIFKGANAADYAIYCDSYCKINGNSLVTFSGTFNSALNITQGSAAQFAGGIATTAGTTIGGDMFLIQGASSLLFSGPLTAVAATSVAEMFGARSGSTICASIGTVTGTFTGARQWSILGNSVFSNLTTTAVPGTAGIITAAGFANGFIGGATSGGC